MWQKQLSVSQVNLEQKQGHTSGRVALWEGDRSGGLVLPALGVSGKISGSAIPRRSKNTIWRQEVTGWAKKFTSIDRRMGGGIAMQGLWPIQGLWPTRVPRPSGWRSWKLPLEYVNILLPESCVVMAYMGEADFLIISWWCCSRAGLVRTGFASQWEDVQFGARSWCASGHLPTCFPPRQSSWICNSAVSDSFHFPVVCSP